MGDGYFYTLSAIAQSFAAIVALHAVFVIYKLQTLKIQRDDFFKELRDIVYRKSVRSGVAPDTAHVRVERMSNEDVLNKARTIAAEHPKYADRIQETLDRIGKNDSCRRSIARWLKNTLAFNGTTIVSSLFLLPWKNLFPLVLQYIVMIMVLLLSLFALLTTIHAILITIGYGIPIISKIFKEDTNP